MPDTVRRVSRGRMRASRARVARPDAGCPVVHAAPGAMALALGAVAPPVAGAAAGARAARRGCAAAPARPGQFMSAAFLAAPRAGRRAHAATARTARLRVAAAAGPASKEQKQARHRRTRSGCCAAHPSAAPPVAQMLGFPFVKIVGQEDMKLALMLNVVDSRIGGVLIMGDRGTGKSVAVRTPRLPCALTLACPPARVGGGLVPRAARVWRRGGCALRCSAGRVSLLYLSPSARCRSARWLTCCPTSTSSRAITTTATRPTRR
jgi:hypothetical protein